MISFSGLFFIYSFASNDFQCHWSIQAAAFSISLTHFLRQKYICLALTLVQPSATHTDTHIHTQALCACKNRWAYSMWRQRCCFFLLLTVVIWRTAKSTRRSKDTQNNNYFNGNETNEEYHIKNSRKSMQTTQNTLIYVHTRHIFALAWCRREERERELSS